MPPSKPTTLATSNVKSLKKSVGQSTTARTVNNKTSPSRPIPSSAAKKGKDKGRRSGVAKKNSVLSSGYSSPTNEDDDEDVDLDNSLEDARRQELDELFLNRPSKSRVSIPIDAEAVVTGISTLSIAPHTRACAGDSTASVTPSATQFISSSSPSVLPRTYCGASNGACPTSSVTEGSDGDKCIALHRGGNSNSAPLDSVVASIPEERAAHFQPARSSSSLKLIDVSGGSAHSHIESLVRRQREQSEGFTSNSGSTQRPPRPILIDERHRRLSKTRLDGAGSDEKPRLSTSISFDTLPILERAEGRRRPASFSSPNLAGWLPGGVDCVGGKRIKISADVCARAARINREKIQTATWGGPGQSGSDSGSGGADRRRRARLCSDGAFTYGQFHLLSEPSSPMLRDADSDRTDGTNITAWEESNHHLALDTSRLADGSGGFPSVGGIAGSESGCRSPASSTISQFSWNDTTSWGSSNTLCTPKANKVSRSSQPSAVSGKMSGSTGAVPFAFDQHHVVERRHPTTVFAPALGSMFTNLAMEEERPQHSLIAS